MKEVVIDKCPYCGGGELKEVAVRGYGWSDAYLHGGCLKNVALYALTCRDCGSVVRFYCKEPEKLYPKKDRRQ